MIKAYFIVRDFKRKAIVLGIRGTLSPRDVLTDLCASSENFIVEDALEDVDSIGDIGYAGEVYASSTLMTPAANNGRAVKPPLLVGRAHKGMLDAAKSVARMTATTITEELQSNPEFSLIIVGHSLGGGVAAVLAAMWSRRFPDRIKSFGYGNPCVFPLDWCRSPSLSSRGDYLIEECSNIVSVVAEGDPFSRISLGHVADITKALSQLCQNKGFREEILRRTDVGKSDNVKDMSDEEFTWCANAMAFLRQQMTSEKLYPPGQVYIMGGSLFEFNAEGRGSMGMIKRVDAIKFKELKLHARMFDLSLHIPARYETVLQRLAASEAAMFSDGDV